MHWKDFIEKPGRCLFSEVLVQSAENHHQQNWLIKPSSFLPCIFLVEIGEKRRTGDYYCVFFLSVLEVFYNLGILNINRIGVCFFFVEVSIAQRSK